MFQLSPNHQDEIVRTAEVSFTFNGKSLLAHKGESLAAALMRAKLLHLSDSPADGAPRGVFCCMGLCQECVVQVDGKTIESCRLPVSKDLQVISGRR
jgi:aerobic-type carbon monoxide dehydrogenase small subunit (CoxS/CutS family)